MMSVIILNIVVLNVFLPFTYYTLTNLTSVLRYHVLTHNYSVLAQGPHYTTFY